MLIINGQWLFSLPTSHLKKSRAHQISGENDVGGKQKKTKRRCQAGPVVVGRRKGSWWGRGRTVRKQACRAPGCRRLGRPWARMVWEPAISGSPSFTYWNVLSLLLRRGSEVVLAVRNCPAAMPFPLETFPSFLGPSSIFIFPLWHWVFALLNIDALSFRKVLCHFNFFGLMCCFLFSACFQPLGTQGERGVGGDWCKLTIIYCKSV